MIPCGCSQKKLNQGRLCIGQITEFLQINHKWWEHGRRNLNIIKGLSVSVVWTLFSSWFIQTNNIFRQLGKLDSDWIFDIKELLFLFLGVIMILCLKSYLLERRTESWWYDVWGSGQGQRKQEWLQIYNGSWISLLEVVSFKNDSYSHPHQE